MQLLEWVSGLAWPLVFLTFLVLCLLTVELFSIVSRRFDPKDRTNDNIGRASLAFLGSAFIFVGAFTIITSWTEDAKLHTTAEREVVVAQTLMREVRLLAPADSTIRRALGDYAVAVLRGETGEGGELASSTAAEDAFVVVENATIVLIEQPGIDTYRAEEVLESLHDLKLAREERVSELGNTVALPLVLLLLVMAALNLAGIGLFPGGTSRGLKVTFGVVVAVAVASMLTSVVVLESLPFIQPRLALPVESLIADVNSG